MHPTETGRSYDMLASFWQEHHRDSSYGVAQHERALKFVKTRRHALDIGCGSSARVVDLLAKEGFEVEGIDVSEKMIALIRELRPSLSVRVADITTWNFPRRYDFISAWDSLWHLPLESHEPVLRKIGEGLVPGGVFLFTLAGLDDPVEKTDTNMGPPVHYSSLGISKTLRLLDQVGCVCRHFEFDQHPEMHAYVVVQKRGFTA